jgi:thioredoxin-like negative regulator of GroEL
MRIDVHEQPDLAERFSVGAVPTLVLVKGSGSSTASTAGRALRRSRA